MPSDIADRMSVRRLWPADRAAFRDHLLRLDSETRRNRFVSAMSDGAVEAYAERAIAADGFMFGVYVEGVLRGVAELRPFTTPAGERQAEAAFSVERPFQLRGLGSALFDRLALAARNRGIRRLQVRCLPYNLAMQALARKMGAQVTTEGFDSEGTVRLDLPTPLSLWRESFTAALDFAVAAIGATLVGPSFATGPR